MTGIATSSALKYPRAERLDLVEDVLGHRVADPYRWLEDPDDPRTLAWGTEQDRLARGWLDALPARDALAADLRRFFATGAVSVPVWRQGRAFFTRREPGGEHRVLHVREPGTDEAGGAGHERVLLDVMALDPSGLTTLDAWSPSREGHRVAVQISRGGDEESAFHVLDVTTGRMLDGPIDRCRYSPVAWLPGGDELYYVRRLPAEDVPEGEHHFHRRVWRHRVGADPATDELVHGEGLDPTNYYGVRVSPDGRWLVISACPGTARRDSVWIADLHGGPERATPRQVLSDDDAVRAAAWVARDGRLYLLTTWGAPRWRLCVADPADPAPQRWTELIPEDPDSVLDAVRWLDDEDGTPLLVASRTRHAVTELHLHRAADGSHRGTVPLPGTGSLTGLTTADELTPERAGQVWIGWTDITTPPGVHHYTTRTAVTTLAEPAPGAVALPQVDTRQVSYHSADGTTVRMFVVSRADGPDDQDEPDGEPPDASGAEAGDADGNASEADGAGGASGDRAPHGPRPALLTGYGGFALSREPAYSATALAWVAAGGVWAQPSLRGGGEEGEDWHRAGMRERKQNTFDDFHAAADLLVEQGWTTREQLAISGGSNGGLLMGAALTQRPHAYRAVVCSAPLLDMVRYERFLLGRTWNDEYGSAAHPDELGWLLSYSPYHHVRDGVDYPAVLFTVFDSDSRVDPLHGRKMCAALQHATSADPARAPVLLRREGDVGHSARAVSRAVAVAVDQLGFLAHHTGLDLAVAQHG